MKRNYVEKFKYIAGKKFQLSIKSTLAALGWLAGARLVVPPMVESNKKQTQNRLKLKLGTGFNESGNSGDSGMLVSCLLLCERNIIQEPGPARHNNIYRERERAEQKDKNINYY